MTRPISVKRKSVGALMLAVVFTMGSAAEAQDTAPATAPTVVHANIAPAKRADLAAAYLRFEHALANRKSKPSAVDMTDINRVFDLATLDFFKGRSEQAVKTMNDLAYRAQTDRMPAQRQSLISSLKVRMNPAVYSLDSGGEATARVMSMYSIPTNGNPIDFTFRIVGADHHAVFEQAFLVATDPFEPVDATVAVREFASPLQPGMYTIEFTGPDNERAVACQWPVVPSSLDAARDANAAKLDAIAKERSQLLRPIAVCRARNKLLTDSPSAMDSSQFLLDPLVLLGQLNGEIKALQEGRHPYARRPGDLWRTLAVESSQIPFRLYVPARMVDQPMPLVIALHGAGGDENMFMEAYGLGTIKRLADERGFIVVAPLIYNFDPAAFDALVEELGSLYKINRQQIFVIGHSLGAGIAAGFAALRHEQVAAVCCIAGGVFSNQQMSPTLVIGAQFDGLFPPDKLKSDIEKVKAMGMPIEFRIQEGCGHTLVVSDALPEAITWLLQHQLGEPPS